MQIGNNIRKIREIKGFSQEYMAIQLEISQKTYSRIENEKGKIDFKKIEKISNILEIDSIKLLTFEYQHIFNNHEQTGVNTSNVMAQAFSVKERQLYEKRIKHLEGEILFLRKVLLNNK